MTGPATTPTETLRPRPLIPPRQRAAAVVGTALGATTFLLVGFLTHDDRATAVDLEVDDWLRPRLDGLAPVFDLLVSVAAPQRMLFLCALLSGAALARGHPRAAALSILGPAAALLLVHQAQETWDRPSATVLGQGGAYPSGHTAGVVALLTLVMVLTAREGPVGSCANRLLCGAARIGAASFGCAVMVALTAMRHHYVTDVVGGAALAAAWIIGTALLLDTLCTASLRARLPERPTITPPWQDRQRYQAQSWPAHDKDGVRPGAPSELREGPP